MKISKWKQFNESISDTFSKQREELATAFKKEIDNKIEEMKVAISDCVSDLTDIAKDSDNTDYSSNRFDNNNYYGRDNYPPSDFKQLTFLYYFEFSETESRTTILEALWESINKLNSIDADIKVYIDKGFDILFKFEDKDLTYNKISKAILSKKLSKGEFKIKIHIS